MSDTFWKLKRNSFKSVEILKVWFILPGEHSLTSFEKLEDIALTLISLFSSIITGWIFRGWFLRIFSNIIFSWVLSIILGHNSDILTKAAPCSFDHDHIGGRLPWKCWATLYNWLSVTDAGTTMYWDRLVAEKPETCMYKLWKSIFWIDENFTLDIFEIRYWL